MRNGHPSTLHLWWNRRPLTASRAMIFASVVDDPDSPGAPPKFVDTCRRLPPGRNAALNDTPRHRLLDFVERLVQWESTSDEEVMGTARELIRLATDGHPPPLRDPFAGGGSIPLEAQRLGLETYASDVDPVSVMICKALIEIPPRFNDRPPVNPHDRGNTTRGAAGLAADVRYYGRWMRDRAWEQVGHLYPEYVPAEWGLPQRVTAWIWARTVECPNPDCGAKMPLATSFWLCRRKGRPAWVAPRVDSRARTVDFDIGRGSGKPVDPPKVGRGTRFRCIVCGTVTGVKHLRDEGSAGRMGAQLMAIVTEGRHGRNYFAPLREQVEAATMAGPSWKAVSEAPEDTPDLSPPFRGTIAYEDLFTPRQLLILATLSNLVGEAREQVRIDGRLAGLPVNPKPLRVGGAGVTAYSEAVSVYLALGLSRLAAQLSTLCSWDTRSENVRQVFARRPVRMAWDYAEANPFAASSSNILGQLEPVCRTLETMSGSRPGSATRRDATTFGYRQHCLFATDPPYYDHTVHAGLSEYAYVWLRRSLSSVYPDPLSAPLLPKDASLVASVRHPDDEQNPAGDPFAQGLLRAFRLIRGGADFDYPLTTFCAYQQAEHGAPAEEATDGGWETMLDSLIRAGFTVVGTWPIRTEPSKDEGAGLPTPAPAVILACRPRPRQAPTASRPEFASALRRELPPAMRELQSSNVAPADLAQMSIGPGLAVYSRYSAVLEPDGSLLTLRTALDIIDRSLEVFLVEQEDHLDHNSHFAIAWFDRFGYTTRSIEEVGALARIRNTSVDRLIADGIIRTRGSRAWLVHWPDLDGRWDPATDKRPAVWKATHHLIWRLKASGERAASRLIARMPPGLAPEARQLAYRLYSISDRKGWVEETQEYGELITSWGAIQPKSPSSPGLYHQRRLFE